MKINFVLSEKCILNKDDKYLNNWFLALYNNTETLGLFICCEIYLIPILSHPISINKHILLMTMLLYA